MPRLGALCFVLLAFLVPPGAVGQDFLFGNDLSYVNQMEDCGAVFKEDGAPKDVYRIFADHGANLVRVRLWVDPDWQHGLVQPAGVKPQYSDLADVRETIARAHRAGMRVLLAFHYSDFWADPGRQVVPARWRAVARDTDALADSVYAYTRRVLAGLDADGLMPALVQVGNETNGGMMTHTRMNARYEAEDLVSWSWDRQAVLFNAAIRAVREVGASASVDPRVVVHVADPANASWFVPRLRSEGVTDFDVLGLSFYYTWHGHTIDEAAGFVRSVRSRYPALDVMIVETGYLWSTRNHDALGNIINTADPAYLPVSPATQLEYQVDLTRAMRSAGAAGVVFWEPAWVSTPCRTPWGQGSSHDHVAFFEPGTNDFIEEGAGRWAEPSFYASSSPREARGRIGGLAVHAPAPNPAGDVVRVAFEVETPSDVTVAVYDLLGRRVRAVRAARLARGAHEVTLHVGGLPGGTYLVRVVTPDATATRRFVRIG